MVGSHMLESAADEDLVAGGRDLEAKKLESRSSISAVASGRVSGGGVRQTGG